MLGLRGTLSFYYSAREEPSESAQFRELPAVILNILPSRLRCFLARWKDSDYFNLRENCYTTHTDTNTHMQTHAHIHAI